MIKVKVVLIKLHAKQVSHHLHEKVLCVALEAIQECEHACLHSSKILFLYLADPLNVFHTLVHEVQQKLYFSKYEAE